jgi:hypothetical protein
MLVAVGMKNAFYRPPSALGKPMPNHFSLDYYTITIIIIIICYDILTIFGFCRLQSYRSMMDIYKRLVL